MVPAPPCRPFLCLASATCLASLARWVINKPLSNACNCSVSANSRICRGCQLFFLLLHFGLRTANSLLLHATATRHCWLFKIEAAHLLLQWIAPAMAVQDSQGSMGRFCLSSTPKIQDMLCLVSQHPKAKQVSSACGGVVCLKRYQHVTTVCTV